MKYTTYRSVKELLSELDYLCRKHSDSGMRKYKQEEKELSLLLTKVTDITKQLEELLIGGDHDTW